MKKILMIAALAALACTMTGCCSMRTPEGKNNQRNYYMTFFGMSIESAIFGDGFIVNSVDNSK